MHVRRVLITFALVATGCGGTLPTPAPSASPTPALGTPTSRPASVAATNSPASLLEGTWVTGQTTCDQQHAAVEAAGFTADEIEAAGWDAATCGDLMHGSQFTIRFAGDRLVAFNDGAVGWDGRYQVVDARTFEAGDVGDYYITYEYVIEGNELTIDMVRDDYPTSSPEELAGEQIAQTVIYESAPFTRQP